VGIAEVEFRLLGPVQVRLEDRAVDIGAARQQSLLTVLLLEAGRCVPVDQIVERVWGQQRLPDQPRNAVHTYVSLLRTALVGIGGVTITRQAGGYLIDIDTRLVDVHRFRALIEQARDAGDDDRAAALAEEALGLWRGEPFAGLDTPWINATREGLAVRRQAARLDLMDIRLRCGRHADVLAELAAEAAAHPFDERVTGQLMLALYRVGRPSDALAQYQRIRQQLAGELGTDPGPALRDLHQRILVADPALAVPARTAAVPRQLPAAPRLFTGRTRELTRLSAVLDEGSESGRTLVLSAIGGIGGIGKTWLALHWAHQHLDRFPDGQLYVNLRGFDPSGEPLPAEAAVRGFLDALGVGPAAIPADLDAQIGLYRSLVAGKRVLIVADNARDTAQVVPLLPGSPTCAVLVTSRRGMPGLITAHGAHAVDLDVLPDGEACQLIARHLGGARVAAEPDAVAALVERCGGLPLALSVVAARAITQPGLPLAVLAGDLRDASARLDALATADLTANVRATLSWSYDALDAETARVFGLLALAPGPDIDAAAAASLTALPAGRLRGVLQDLEYAHLLARYGPGRYRMHDLVRLYAAERARTDQPAPDRTAALRRVVDFYLHTAFAADRVLAPRRQPIDISPAPAELMPDPPANPATAMAWFGQEHACLRAAQQVAFSEGWHARAWQLAWALDTFRDLRGLWLDQVSAWRLAIDAAGLPDDPKLRGMAHQQYGYACARAGDTTEAFDHLYRALAVAEQNGDVTVQAQIHHVLGGVWGLHGDDQRALTHASHSLRIFQALDNPTWHSYALNGVGWFHARLGDYSQARAACQAALALHTRHQVDARATLDTLGYIAYQTHDYQQALDYYQQALTGCRNAGDVNVEGDVLNHIAEVHFAVGQPDTARETWHQALELFRIQHRLADAERVQRQLAALDAGQGPPSVRR
jgi:DNA-binding SARP family transcriptional activator/tetratricopeptide (TPR) repeat protein